MKNLFKNVNTFGLMGVLLASGLVFTQSAFTSAKSDKAVELIYGYDYSTQSWNPVAPDNGYRCVDGTNICKFTFTTPPTSANTPQNSTPAQNSGLGSYENP